ncbi:MAG: Xaa-Pro peptidase family protein [Desulfobacterales bacterium]|nr:Xaa-Pro peptidase family protein [Desulfobacterales bacterium]
MLKEGFKMPEEEISRRLSNARREMAEKEIEVLVVFSAPGSMRYGQRGHVLYLSGYEPYFGDSMMILPLDDKLEPVLETGSASYFPEQCTWLKNRAEAGNHIDVIKTYLSDNSLNSSKIGVAGEYSLSPLFYHRMTEELKPAQVEIFSQILERQRSVKSEFEIDCMKQTAMIGKKGFEAAAAFIKPGVTEADVVSEVEKVCREHGSQGFPHYTMVISGKDEKHLGYWWNCGGRKLEQGDPISIDYGAMYNGYCSDLSRPFVVGKASDKQKDVVKVLVEAQEAAAEIAKPGVYCSELADAVSRVMEKAWGIKDLGAGLGHGVGLEVHEWPFVGYHHIKDDDAYRDTVLEENIVISMEPMMYFPDAGDFQIEDQFFITKNGAVRMNDIPQQIFEI